MRAAGKAGPDTALACALVSLTVAASFTLFGVLLEAKERDIRAAMLAGVALCAAWAILRIRRPEQAAVALLAAGVVMRIGYMLYTPFALRGHDVGELGESGHLSYLYGFVRNWALPQSNEYQFYHPPLQHILQAVAVKTFSFMTGRDAAGLLEAAKIVPCWASCAMLPLVWSLCRAAGLPPRTAVWALAVLAFHPSFLILSASVNNDALALFFFWVSILYAFRWHGHPGMGNALAGALFAGLSAMAKLSGAIALFFWIPLIAARFFRKPGCRDIMGLVRQAAAFALAFLPLALWYPIRNLILFGQPLGYVLALPAASPLYCGDMPASARFLSLPVRALLDPVYCRPMQDCNVWLYTLKCSVFGEWRYDRPVFLARLLLAANFALVVFSTAAMVHAAARRKDLPGVARFGLPGIWLAQMASYVVFNLRFPFGCSMDFRYIMSTAVTGAICAGIALDGLAREKKIPAAPLRAAGIASVVLFAASSVLFYAGIGGGLVI